MKQLFGCDIPDNKPHTVEKYKKLIAESASEMGFSSNAHDPFKLVRFKDINDDDKIKYRLEAMFETGSLAADKLGEKNIMKL